MPADPNPPTSFRLGADAERHLADLIAALSADVPVNRQDVVRLALRKLWEERCRPVEPARK